MGIQISMVDASDLSKLKAAIKPKTKVKKISSGAFSANYYNYMLHITDVCILVWQLSYIEGKPEVFMGKNAVCFWVISKNILLNNFLRIEH